METSVAGARAVVVGQVAGVPAPRSRPEGTTAPPSPRPPARRSPSGRMSVSACGAGVAGTLRASALLSSSIDATQIVASAASADGAPVGVAAFRLFSAVAVRRAIA